MAETKTVKAPAKKTVTKVQSSLSVDVMDIKGKVLETMSLPEFAFKAKENPVLVAQAVRVHLANQRQGTVATKSRNQINATTKKVWRQKGTGRARHGAKSAPIFVGGGVAFGPKPRDFSLSFPKKMRRAALFSVLTSRLKNKDISVVSGFGKIEPKTKNAVEVLKNLSFTPAKKSVVIVTDGKSDSVYQASRNIKGVELIPATALNAYDASRGAHILFMKEAVEVLSNHFGKKEEAK